MLCPFGSELRSWRIPTNNQRGRGSRPCLLWVGFDNFGHIVPTVLLVGSAEFIGDLYHMQRYFSHICDGTDVQADWRSCTSYGRAPNAIYVSKCSLTPILHWHETNLFIRWFRHTAPICRHLRNAGDTENVFSTLTPASSRGILLVEVQCFQNEICTRL